MKLSPDLQARLTDSLALLKLNTSGRDNLVRTGERAGRAAEKLERSVRQAGEKLNPHDRNAVEKLAGDEKQSQLLRKLQTSNAAAVEAIDGDTHEFFRTAQIGDFLRELCQPHFMARLDQAARPLLQFGADIEQARAAVRSLPEFVAWEVWLQFSFCYSPGIDAVRTTIGYLESLARGECPFRFDRF